jgi:hypothetical protein
MNRDAKWPSALHAVASRKFGNRECSCIDGSVAAVISRPANKQTKLITDTVVSKLKASTPLMPKPTNGYGVKPV